jgi:hypothetical protein
VTPASPQVPDAIEPIVGWRMWRLPPSALYVDLVGRFDGGAMGAGSPAQVEAFWLRSGNGEPWIPGRALQARCRSGAPYGKAPVRHDESSPTTGCRCGIYATETRDPLLKFLRLVRRSGLHVFGEVNLWGRVVIHQSGYRSQFAYPRRLWLLNRVGCPEELVKSVLERLETYRVPVAVYDGPLPRRQPAPSGCMPLQDPPRPSPDDQGPIECEICHSKTVDERGRCSNPDHDWAEHRLWKERMKSERKWTWQHTLDDLFEPPPRRGQTYADAENSFLNRSARAFFLTLIFVGGGAVSIALSNLLP